MTTIARLAVLPLFVLALGCSDEGAARQELERDGYTKVKLTRGDHRFDFTADKDGQRCSGTIAVQGDFGSHRVVKFSQCSAVKP